MRGQKTRLPINVMQQIDIDPEQGNYREYLKSWKRGMGDECATVLINLTAIETKSSYRKLHSGPCLGVLEPSDHFLIRNLTTIGGPGERKIFREQDKVKAIERHGNGVTYKAKFMKEPWKTRILYRDMLMSVNHLVPTVGQILQFSPRKTPKKNNLKRNLETTDLNSPLC